MNKQMTLVVIVLCVLGCASFAQESLTPLQDELAPQTHAELWAGYDPRVEPLDVEVLKEWEEDGVLMKVLRYRIGIFKEQKAMMAAVYGYPKGGQDLPGLRTSRPVLSDSITWNVPDWPSSGFQDLPALGSLAIATSLP